MTIDDTAQVLSPKIGKGTKIWQFVIVLEQAAIGANCNINSHCFIENDVIIGNNVTVKCGVQLWDGMRISDNVFIGPNVTFTNDLYPRSKIYSKQFIKTFIGKGVSIGANATIIAGNDLGDYSMIGAGSVITKKVLPYTLWYGNPAKHMGYVTKEGKILSMSLKTSIGEKYKYKNNLLSKIDD